MENWAVAGPLLAAGDGEGDEAALGGLDGVEAVGPGVVDEPVAADGELLQAAKARLTNVRGSHFRQSPGRIGRVS